MLILCCICVAFYLKRLCFNKINLFQIKVILIKKSDKQAVYKTFGLSIGFLILVRVTGLEPAHREAQEPKSCVSDIIKSILSDLSSSEQGGHFLLTAVSGGFDICITYIIKYVARL